MNTEENAPQSRQIEAQSCHIMNNEPTQDAHSLAIALRLARAQIRDLKKALAAIADEWPYHADSPENIRNTAKQALAAIKPNQGEQP